MVRLVTLGRCHSLCTISGGVGNRHKGGFVEADGEETAEKMELSTAEVQEGWASVFVACTHNSLTLSIKREK